MTVRALIAVAICFFLWMLVILQIRAAAKDGYLTVEQNIKAKRRALSFDRHYAMPLDFAIIAPFIGLCIFICAGQWGAAAAAREAGVTLAALLPLVWLWSGGTEAHAHDGRTTRAGWYHALFAAVAVWTFLMVLVETATPPSVLLLMSALVVPAFLFVGQHLFLGVINLWGDATSYGDKPLRNWLGYAVLTAGTGLVWWRSYLLIPEGFIDSLR